MAGSPRPCVLCRPRRAFDLPHTPTSSAFEDRSDAGELVGKEGIAPQAAGVPASADTPCKETVVQAINDAPLVEAAEPRGSKDGHLSKMAIAAPLSEESVVNQAPAPVLAEGVHATVAVGNAAVVLPKSDCYAASVASTKLSRRQRKMLAAPPPFVPEVKDTVSRQHCSP